MSRYKRIKVLILLIIQSVGLHIYIFNLSKSNILSSIFLLMMCFGIFINLIDVVLFMVSDWKEGK
jgi:hypothetical protein